MTNDEKIEEIVNQFPINSEFAESVGELEAYKQGLRCGASNMAEWKDKNPSDNLIRLIVRSVLDGYDVPLTQRNIDMYMNIVKYDLKKGEIKL